MEQRALTCFCPGPVDGSLPIHAIRPPGLSEFLHSLPAAQAAYLSAIGFTARPGSVALLPEADGLGGAVLGLGEAAGPQIFGALPPSLPPGTVWHLSDRVADTQHAVLGFALGAYRYDGLKQLAAPPGPRLVLPAGTDLAATLSAARATWMVRDLVNMPANLLGPGELAGIAQQALLAQGCRVQVIAGQELEQRYPLVHLVGCGSDRAPAVLVGEWANARANEHSPLISICGKGVCFDTGGYDIKTASGMLRMKKDMAGAAIALGLAMMAIEADLPIRLEVRLGCVENMISGSSMRPLDVVKSRHGLSVEVGNTDAEGRLVLCDLISEACEARPDLLLDFATLTGAARTALGPELPALFSNDDAIADALVRAGQNTHDPVWRLPIWQGYNYWLESGVADLNNVSEKAQAGAIVAALFLQRFVFPGVGWAHFDVYGWNDTARPGAPAGGEAQGMRAAFACLSAICGSAGGPDADI